MNVDNLSSLKQLLFGNFTKSGEHVATQHKAPTATSPSSFASLLGHARKAGLRPAGNGAPPNLVEDVMAAADPKKAENAQVALLNLNGRSGAAGKTDAKASAMLALEGTLMTKFVDQMLPKSSSTLYGAGTAGDTWRGFAVDQFGAVLAKSDPLNFGPAPSGVKLAASASVTNLFGGGFDDQQPTQPITPFST